jgi:hypothetical protein
VVAIKNGSTYSVSKYWTKGTTFHFITTQGEHFQIPVSRLEHLYPPQKN